MYHFLFAFFYYYYTRFKDTAPNNSATLALILLEFLHFFCLGLIVLKLIGIDRSVAEPFKGGPMLIYTLILMAPFFVFNFMYFKKERRSQILEKYKREDILNMKNGILIFSLLLILPILIIIFLSPKAA